MEWTESGVAGAYRFTQRIYRLAATALPGLPPAGTSAEGAAGEAKKLRQVTHRTIAAVTEALDSFAFNVAVARIHEFANAIGEAGEGEGLGAAKREALEAIARLASPMMPHLAEELWSLLRPGEDRLVAQLPWLEPDPALLKAESLTLAVQVLGKLRGTIEVPIDADEATIFAMAEAEVNVQRTIAGKPIRKRIHVPGRVVNFVV